MGRQLERVLCDVTALTGGAATVEIDLGSLGLAHWFVGVQFYTSAAGTTLATPTAGTITPSVKTEALPDVYQALDQVVNLASKNVEIDWASPSKTLKLVLANVAGGSATHFKVIPIAVRS